MGAFQPFADFERETLARATGPYRTQFGAVPYHARHQKHGNAHEWLIKGVMTRGEQAMLVGASQTGKSFLAYDISMAIARGVPWMGHKTRRGLVIYHAGESAKGVRDKRQPAYDRAHGLENDLDHPFVLLTLPLDLYSSDEDTLKLIAECRHWMEQYPDFGFELLVIDTFAAATPGADENAGKDVGAIRRRCKRIEQELGCAVLLVHHKNASGTKARGHTSMFADVENVLDVSLVMTGPEKTAVPLKDINGRKVREAVVTKLKDGEDGTKFRFVLEGVQLGVDEDGDDVTSCVIRPPDMGDVEPSPDEKAAPDARLPRRQYIMLKAIEDALKAHGQMPAPDGVPVPNNVPVVEWRIVRDLFSARWFEDDQPDEEKRKAALRRAWKDAGEGLYSRGYIRKHETWIWRTRKRLPSERDRADLSRQDADPVTPVPDAVTEFAETTSWEGLS
ncbi:AAA family ATPase [Methylobacterium aquaticum]|uniref:AAA family ATPase n=1 Tax=Methylobacterium aquaticum TaxID=270351 RepID=UPI003D168256